MIKVNEIFQGIKGDGFYSGKACIFVTFGSPQYKEGLLLDVKTIMDRIRSFKNKFVVFNGDEPTNQDLTPLLYWLNKEKYYVLLETGGANNPSYLSSIDWVSVRPNSTAIKVDLTKVKELKIIVSKVVDSKFLKDTERNLEDKFLMLYLQPESMSNEHIKEALELIKENNNWRLSLSISNMKF